MGLRQEIDNHADRVQELNRQAQASQNAEDILRLSAEIRSEVRRMGEAFGRLKAEGLAKQTLVR